MNKFVRVHKLVGTSDWRKRSRVGEENRGNGTSFVYAQDDNSKHFPDVSGLRTIVVGMERTVPINRDSVRQFELYDFYSLLDY